MGSDAVGIAGATNNVGLGNRTFEDLTSGVQNVGVGSLALLNLTTGSNNVGVGYLSLATTTNGFENVCVGTQSGFVISSGSNNSALGFLSLVSLTTGQQNSAFGSNALGGLSTGSFNSGFGAGATVGTTGSYNTTLGYLSGSLLATGSSNILINSDGANPDSNTLRIGMATGAGNRELNRAFIHGINGVTLGGTPLMVTIDSSTSQLGVAAVPSSSISITGDTGGALTGAAFTFTGGGASKAGVTVQFEGSGTTQTLNVTDANGNTILGGGLAINSGNANAGIGQSVLGNCTGDNNMAMGAAALFALTSGDDNIGIGYQALYAGAGIGITKGNRNIGIGSNAGSAYTESETDNILIGYQVTGTVAENHVLRIGNGTGSETGNLSKAFIAGINGVTSSNPLIVTINSATDQLGVTALSPSSLFPWSVITANQTAAVNNGYFCNKAGTLTLALPASSAVGDVIEVANINTATGTQITQAAGQQIFIGNTNTTSGAGGSLTSSATGDTLKLVCRTANTVWQVISMIGNWSIV